MSHLTVREQQKGKSFRCPKMTNPPKKNKNHSDKEEMDSESNPTNIIPLSNHSSYQQTRGTSYTHDRDSPYQPNKNRNNKNRRESLQPNDEYTFGSARNYKNPSTDTQNKPPGQWYCRRWVVKVRGVSAVVCGYLNYDFRESCGCCGGHWKENKYLGKTAFCDKCDYFIWAMSYAKGCIRCGRKKAQNVSFVVSAFNETDAINISLFKSVAMVDELLNNSNKNKTHIILNMRNPNSINARRIASFMPFDSMFDEVFYILGSETGKKYSLYCMETYDFMSELHNNTPNPCGVVSKQLRQCNKYGDYYPNTNVLGMKVYYTNASGLSGQELDQFIDPLRYQNSTGKPAVYKYTSRTDYHYFCSGEEVAQTKDGIIEQLTSGKVMIEGIVIYIHGNKLGHGASIAGDSLHYATHTSKASHLLGMSSRYLTENNGFIVTTGVMMDKPFYETIMHGGGVLITSAIYHYLKQ